MLKFDEIKAITGENGLSTSQIEALRKQFGVNTMTPPVRDPLWKQYLKKFDNPIIKILLLAVGISIIVFFSKGKGYSTLLGFLSPFFFLRALRFSTNTEVAKNSKS
jgi:Ca2+-transporting ATPase